MKVGLFSLKRKIGYETFLPKFQQSQANTAFCHHQKRTYAMLEADLPFHIKIDRDDKGFDIRSIGFEDFGGQLKHNVSAHPKVDARSGELCAFGYDMVENNGSVHFSLINKDKKVLSYMNIPITSPRMIHDFGITENYIIVPDLPLEMNIKNAIDKNDVIFKYDTEKPSRYGIMKKLNQAPDQIQWFEMPNHFVFHYVNSWEDQNENGETVVTLWGCTVLNVSLNFNEEHPFWGKNIKNFLTKMTFNLSTGQSTFDRLHPEYSVEFPVISQELIGYKTRYTYLS